MIEELEMKNRWDEETISLLEKNAIDDKTPDGYIRLLFTCWYLLLEKDVVVHFIPNDFLSQKLRNNYNSALLSFKDNERFMFYTGWMLNIAPWYFGIDDDSLGNGLMLKAYLRKPGNPLYKWACRGPLNLSEETASSLAKHISDSEFDHLGYTLKKYFKEMLG